MNLNWINKKIAIIFLFIFICVSVGISLYLQQKSNTKKQKSEKPTAKVYINDQPKNTLVTINKNKDSFDINLSFSTNKDFKSYIYMTTNPEEKIIDAINKENEKNKQVTTINYENAVSPFTSNQNLENIWLQTTTSQSIGKNHSVIISSSFIKDLIDKLKTNKQEELYYYIVLIDKDGYSYPYGNFDYTDKTQGPTKGYKIKLSKDIYEVIK